MLKYFNLKNEDASLISWSHAVNTKIKLDESLKSDLMFLEADILFKEEKHSEPIMAHPPLEDSDLKFSEFIELSKSSGKGLKLDFKTANSVEPCLSHLSSIEIKSPIILNADIFQGHRSTPSNFDPINFILTALKLYPNCILSLGWTTTSCPLTSYSWSNVFQAYSLLKSFDTLDKKLEITFAVRALWSVKSMHRLVWLFTHTKCSFTIWSHETDKLSSLESLLLFRKYFPNNCIFYDLPSNQHEYFKAHAYDQNLLNNLLTQSNDQFVKFHLNEKHFDPESWNFQNALKFDYGAVLLGNGSCLVSKSDFKGLNYKLYGKFEFFPLAEYLNNPCEDTCVRISVRSSVEAGLGIDRHSNGSVNIYVYSRGIVKVFRGNKLEIELFLREAIYCEYHLEDLGQEKDLKFRLDTVDSDFNNHSTELIIKSDFEENQEFYISKTLLSDSFGLGIDAFRVAENLKAF